MLCNGRITLRAAAQMSRSVEDSSNSFVISSAISSGVSLSASYAKSIVRLCLPHHKQTNSAQCSLSYIEQCACNTRSFGVRYCDIVGGQAASS